MSAPPVSLLTEMDWPRERRPRLRGHEFTRELLAKATEAAESARILFDRGSYEGASNRAFFAMFNTSRALLAARGLNAAKLRSHTKVRAMLARQFVEPGVLSADMTSFLRHADKVRHAGDIEAKDVAPSTARQLVDEMDLFMGRARTLVETQERRRLT